MTRYNSSNSWTIFQDEDKWIYMTDDGSLFLDSTPVSTIMSSGVGLKCRRTIRDATGQAIYDNL